MSKHDTDNDSSTITHNNNENSITNTSTISQFSISIGIQQDEVLFYYLCEKNIYTFGRRKYENTCKQLGSRTLIYFIGK